MFVLTGLLARFSTPGGFSLDQVLQFPKESITGLTNSIVRTVTGVPVLGSAIGILEALGLFEFKTHRPDSNELPPGTQWLDGTPDAGVLRYWYGGRGIDWTGEILTTSPGNIPIACWDYDRQEFDPITAITRQGICIFRTESEARRSELISDDREMMKYIFSDSEIEAARAEAESRGYAWE